MGRLESDLKRLLAAVSGGNGGEVAGRWRVAQGSATASRGPVGGGPQGRGCRTRSRLTTQLVGWLNYFKGELGVGVRVWRVGRGFHKEVGERVGVR